MRQSPGVAGVPLPEAVYRALKGAILQGTLRPGQMLRQEELARQFGVSRAPVREALPRLEAEGMVRLLPRRGYAVVSLDPEEIGEIFELRMLIEDRAAHLATLRRAAEDVARLAAVLAEMAALPLAGPSEIARWAELNFQFHDTMFAASGRRHIRHTVSSLRMVVEPYIRFELAMTGDIAEAHREHELLLEAFARGDADRCAALNRQHCEHTARRLIEGLHLRGTGPRPDGRPRIV